MMKYVQKRNDLLWFQDCEIWNLKKKTITEILKVYQKT